MSKIKKKKELQKIQRRRRKLESAQVTWQTNNPWYDFGIKKRISKGWPSKKNQSLMKKNVKKNLGQFWLTYQPAIRITIQ
jgi:hypothetical protein